MKPVADILAVLVVTLFVLAYRRHRNGWDLVGAGIVAASLAVDLARWPTIRVQLGLPEVALGAVAVFGYFNLVGFPRLVVRHLRVGYRSAKWDFDRRLHDEKARLDAVLLEYRSFEDWGRVPALASEGPGAWRSHSSPNDDDEGPHRRLGGRPRRIRPAVPRHSRPSRS